MEARTTVGGSWVRMAWTEGPVAGVFAPPHIGGLRGVWE